jgi:NADPH:quinone reductase-like Zn-dependent oxidoreductase
LPGIKGRGGRNWYAPPTTSVSHPIPDAEAGHSRAQRRDAAPTRADPSRGAKLAMAETGGYAETVTVASDQCYRLPASMSFAEAASLAVVYARASDGGARPWRHFPS